ncbi:MAG: hypothetical protein LUG93_04810 [Lachnospiraceae bacterium]|nr:hypothetical protein [Lachnospiraceae bacterium]
MRAFECVAEKFIKIPNIQNYEVETKTEDGFKAVIEMEDGFIFKIWAYVFAQVYPSTILKLCGSKNVSLTSSVIVAPYISERSAEICREKRLGYFDYAGNCWFTAHSIYISERGNKNLFVEGQKQTSFFERSSKVSSLILRELFVDYRKVWRLKHLAERVECSIGQASNVMNYLIKNAWAEKRADGYAITEPEELLREWSTGYGKKTSDFCYCYSLETIPEIEEKLRKIRRENNIDYYLSGFSGGVRYAPVVRYNKVHVYFSPEDVREAIQLLDLKRVDSGANVIIYPAADSSYLKDSRIVENDQVVSPVQIYLDCMQLKGRGEEMAEAILNRVILK